MKTKRASLGQGWGAYAGMVAGLLSGGLVSQAQPVNDSFSARTALSGTNVIVQGNNAGASTEPGENTGGGSLSHSVWYSWTAPTHGVLRVSGSTSVPEFILSIGTYQGTAIDTLAPAPATPDGGLAVTTGDTIVFQVGSVYYPICGCGGGSGLFTLHLALEVPTPTSPNDAFADRIEVALARYHFEGSIYGATTEPGEPLPTPDTTQTLWWGFDAPSDGLLNILLAAGQFPASLGVYEGTRLDALTPLSAVNGARYPVQGGRHYGIQVASGPATSGTFGLDVRFHSASNDFFAGSERLEGTNLTYYGNFTRATPEPGEPPSGEANTVWLSWAAPFTGPVRYSLATTYQFQYVNVFTGAALGDLQAVPIFSLGNRVLSFIAAADTVYHFQFSGGADDFAFHLEAEPFLPASNDDLAQAQLVEGQVITSAPKSVVGATMEPGEPWHLGAVEQKSIWWRWPAPRPGVLRLSASSTYIPSVVLAVYQGPRVDALGLVGKGTNTVQFSAIGGDTYYIAAAVPAGAMGDIICSAQLLGMSATSALLPGNILREPSWEGTAILGAQYWQMSTNNIGGYVNERGGADGTTWPVLGTGARIWQEFPTIPGREYAVQFAYRVGGNLSGCCGMAGVRVWWDDRDLGIVALPESETFFWHWDVLTVQASNLTSRITFENVHRNLEMDAFSVVDLDAPPSIVTHPVTASTVVGGAAAFIVGASGTAPLAYQWFFNDQPISGRTTSILVLDRVTVEDAGTYWVTVTNALGSVTSAPAVLIVEDPTNATILLQPYGDCVPAGGYFNFSVVAAGRPPLTYQWFFNGEPIADATNRHLVLPGVQLTNAGTYQARVQNDAGSVWSLPANLIVTNAIAGGGTVYFWNKNLGSPGVPTNDAPVFDLDGVTRLSGTNYVAQLYAGPTPESLRPMASPTPFSSGPLAGFFLPQTVTLPHVPPGATAFTQVRAWEIARGSSYDEARALGGKFGRSETVQVTTGGGMPPTMPPRMRGLTSFSLRAGLPAFTVGVIGLVERQPGGVLVWSLRGEAGFRYVVEKTGPADDKIWRPLVVLTNTTGTVTFTDAVDPGADAAFYRARILD